MILDQLDKIGLYETLGKRIAQGLALLKDEKVRSGAVGRYEVDGDKLYYMVQEYDTKPIEEGKLEIHQTYMDIQYVVSGVECMGYAPLNGLKEETAYDSQKDCAFYRYDPSMNRLLLKEGMFAIFWPNEPHMPCRTTGKIEHVKKIVIKVRIE